jgi:high-affinity iron transporter
MILLLAAGMAAHAGAFLVQADTLPSLGQAWNSSGFLSNQSLLGGALQTLVGYDATPSVMQVLIYVATIVLIGSAMKAVNKPRSA